MINHFGFFNKLTSTLLVSFVYGLDKAYIHNGDIIIILYIEIFYWDCPFQRYQNLNVNQVCQFGPTYVRIRQIMFFDNTCNHLSER